MGLCTWLTTLHVCVVPVVLRLILSLTRPASRSPRGKKLALRGILSMLPCPFLPACPTGQGKVSLTVVENVSICGVPPRCTELARVPETAADRE